MKTGREERTSDFRRRTSVEMGGRRMWRPRVARVVASRGQELEVTIRGTLAASALARHCEATGVSLLYLTIDGIVYIPCYDNNGNVTRYLNANGGTFARYSYDAFGRLIARAVDAKGFVLPEVHMRKDKFTKRAKALILAKEDDHVKDLTAWFRSEGKKVVEDYFRNVDRNRFKRYSKQSVCYRTSNEELFHEVSYALTFPVIASQKKWDLRPHGIKAPHDLNLKKNKEGVYDIAE